MPCFRHTRYGRLLGMPRIVSPCTTRYMLATALFCCGQRVSQACKDVAKILLKPPVHDVTNASPLQM